MNLQFYIDYQTVYGQELVLNIVQSDKGDKQKTSKFRMHTFDGYRWECNINHQYTVGT